MKYKKAGNVYIICLERGEFVIESLKKFCTKNKIGCAHFFGLGAVDEVELAHYIVENKKYTSKKFSGPMEATSITGNVTRMDGKPYIHAHITLGKQDMTLIGGHLKEGKVHAVLEVFLTAVKAGVERKSDESLGLNVMKL